MSSSVPHGAYTQRSCFDIVQHKYGANDEVGAFIEVLEIRDAPEGKPRFVLHTYLSLDGSTFYEFDSLADASNTHWSIVKTPVFFERHRIRRVVECGKRTPWFYAPSPERVEGDFAVEKRA